MTKIGLDKTVVCTFLIRHHKQQAAAVSLDIELPERMLNVMFLTSKSGDRQKVSLVY